MPPAYSTPPSPPSPAPAGRWFAAAAVLVTAPRLAVAFLEADNIPLPEALRAALFTTSSAATAVALTGGAAYLAWALALAPRGAPLLRALWLAVLAASSALMAPALAAGIQGSPLAAVLDRPWKQWAWAVCAVLSVDLVAAAVMLADAQARARTERQERDADHARAIEELLGQRDQARADLAAARRPAGEAAVSANSASTASPADPANPVDVGLTGTARPARPVDVGPANTASPASPAGVGAAGTARAGAAVAEAAGGWACACGRRFSSQPRLAGHQRWCGAAQRQGRPPDSAAAGRPRP